MNICDKRKLFKLNIDKWKHNTRDCHTTHRTIDLRDTKNVTKNVEYDRIRREYTYDGEF